MDCETPVQRSCFPTDGEARVLVLGFGNVAEVCHDELAELLLRVRNLSHVALFHKNSCAGAGAPGVCVTVKSLGMQRVEGLKGL